jgi:ADP-ribose pyrophosphatase YjhB (NUDIX family)
MEFKKTMTTKRGTFNVYFKDTDPYIDLEGKVLQCVHAFCFYNGQLVLVDHPKSGWVPPGGGIEVGETYEEAVAREVKEETNMEVLHQELIGYMDVYEEKRTVRQTRSFCIVRPYGDFVADPDGEIMQIQLIDPKVYKKYFDWGEIGDYVMDQAMIMAEKYNIK